MRINSLPLAIIAGMTACQGSQQVARPVPSGTLEGNPQVVRVERTTGCGPAPSRSCMNRMTITLQSPRIQGDSLIGYHDRDNHQRTAIALSDITRIESQKLDKIRTGAAVLGGAALALLFAIAYSLPAT